MQHVSAIKTPVSITETPVPVADFHVSVTETHVSAADFPVFVTETPVSLTKTPVLVTETPVSVMDFPVSATETHVSVTKTPVSVAKTPVSTGGTFVKMPWNIVFNKKRGVSTPFRGRMSSNMLINLWEVQRKLREREEQKIEIAYLAIVAGRRKKAKNNVLVALMNKVSDFKIARDSCWYRIPVASAPRIIKDGQADLIAFYHTQIFEKEKFTIQWFARVKQVSVVKRKELFPKLENDPKRDNEYYKIEFEPLQKLAIPIVSIRSRRILFISTNEDKFFSAKEINFLFNDSVLENQLWNEMLLNNIYPERQYFLSVKDKNYFLDFALFCKEKNIDVEVDGDKYHMSEEAVRNDKQRNNHLESKGWSVLRFTTRDLDKDLDRTMDLVRETVNKYGGLQDVRQPDIFNYLNKHDGQTRMFQ